MRGNGGKNSTGSSFPVCSIWNCFWMTPFVRHNLEQRWQLGKMSLFLDVQKWGWSVRGQRKRGGGSGVGWRWRVHREEIISVYSWHHLLHVYIGNGQSISQFSTSKVSCAREPPSACSWRLWTWLARRLKMMAGMKIQLVCMILLAFSSWSLCSGKLSCISQLPEMISFSVFAMCCY